MCHPEALLSREGSPAMHQAYLLTVWLLHEPTFLAEEPHQQHLCPKHRGRSFAQKRLRMTHFEESRIGTVRLMNNPSPVSHDA